MSIATGPDLSQTHCHYNGPRKRCPYCGKKASITSGIAPPTIVSTDLVGELMRRWERRRKSVLENNDPEHGFGNGVAYALSTCIEEIRACAESSSSDKAEAPATKDL